MNKLLALAVTVSAILMVPVGRAQDPVQVDPKHYSVMLDNDQVRVVHIQYGPGEKSVMHSHPDSVVICLTDVNTRMTYPDGKTEPVTGKKGEALFIKATTHQPENVGQDAMDLIQIELKKGAR